MRFKKEVLLGGGLLFAEAVGLYLLYISRTGEAILSPWQTIHPYFIYLFFITTLGLAGLIFTKLPVRWILALVIVHSAVMHFYLPLTHQLIYGADGWRHIATEERLLAGLPLTSATITDATQQSILQSFNLGNLAYRQLWQTSVFLAQVFNLDLLTVTVWLVPILWSIFFPLLIYLLGRALEFGQRGALLLSWFSFWPFALTATGSLTLPVSFSFLPWLWATVLLVRYLKNRKRMTLIGLGILSVVLIFGYTLFAVVWVLQVSLALVLCAVNYEIPNSVIPSEPRGDEESLSGSTIGQLNRDSSPLRRGFGMTSGFITILFGAAIIPAVELVSSYAHVSTSVNWFGQIKQLIGNFTALYLASGPRPHDIATGNIFFNQAPSYAFVANFFTWSRWWLVGFMMVFFWLAGWGIRRLWKSESITNKWLAMITIVFTGSYIVSRYFLVGEQVLSRRLDSVLALFGIVVAAVGVQELYALVINWQYKNFAIAGTLVIVAAAITASYSLGPDTQTVSVDEYKAMQYVWSQEQDKSKHCVTAETYPLLALEAISKKEIIGGGFPIDQYFGQPELEKLMLELSTVPDEQVPFYLTGADTCWIIASPYSDFLNRFLTDTNLPQQEFGRVRVAKYNKTERLED